MTHDELVQKLEDLAKDWHMTAQARDQRISLCASPYKRKGLLVSARIWRICADELERLLNEMKADIDANRE